MSTGSAVRAIQLFHSTLRLYSVVTLIPSWPALCSKTHGMLGYPPVTRVIRGPRTSYRSAAQIDIAESFGTMSHTADVARRRVLPQRHQVTIYRHLGPSRRCGWYLFSPTACVEEAPEDEGNGGRTACRCNLAKRANPTRSPTGSSGLCRGGHEENRGRKEAERAGKPQGRSPLPSNSQLLSLVFFFILSMVLYFVGPDYIGPRGAAPAPPPFLVDSYQKLAGNETEITHGISNRASPRLQRLGNEHDPPTNLGRHPPLTDSNLLS